GAVYPATGGDSTAGHSQKFQQTTPGKTSLCRVHGEPPPTCGLLAKGVRGVKRGAGDFQSSQRLAALAGKQDGDYGNEDNCESDEKRGVGVAREKGEDVSSVGGAEEGEDGVADGAADGHSDQEFGEGILHGARGDDEGD